MSVSILLITHSQIGTALLNAATKLFGQLPLTVRAVTVDYNVDPEQLLPKLRRLTKTLDKGAGVLVLTDLFGSTPGNLAYKLQDGQRIQVIAGLNFPMLVRVMNYPQLTLAELSHKAFSGGRDGVCSSLPYEIA